MLPIILKAKNLCKQFHVQAGDFYAVSDINLDIYQGEILGLVGESGSGKSTLGRLLLHLQKPTTGEVFFKDQRLATLSSSELRALRRHMQMVFQDPFSSLNPRMTLEKIISEPLDIHHLCEEKEKKSRIIQLLEKVGLSASFLNRFPHELSGGQCQRVGIARALACAGEFIILDEPLSALDVTLQAQILKLLKQLRVELGLTFLMIAHDLAVVKAFCDRVAVMYLGEIVEIGPTADVYDKSTHPYTKALLSCVLSTDPIFERAKTQIYIPSDPPSRLQHIKGCPFASRCPIASSLCLSVKPTLKNRSHGHFVACHHA